MLHGDTYRPRDTRLGLHGFVEFAAIQGCWRFIMNDASGEAVVDHVKAADKAKRRHSKHGVDAGCRTQGSVPNWPLSDDAHMYPR